jgi:hypothetical protein
MRRTLGILSLALSLLAGRVDAAEPSEAEKESARTLMDEGDARVGEGDLEGALRAYRGADAVMHVPSTGIEVAATLEKLGRLVDAEEAAQAVLAYPRQADEPEPYSEARRQAEALLARVAWRMPTLTVRPAGERPGEVVLHVDGRARPADQPLRLDPGRHVLRLTSPGSPAAERAVELREGEHRTLDWPLARAPQPPKKMAPAETDPWSSPLGWIGVALSGTGLVLGAGFGIATLDKTAAIEQRCGGSVCPPEERGAIEDADRFANVSNVGFALAGVGAVVAIVGFVSAASGGEMSVVAWSGEGLRLSF